MITKNSIDQLKRESELKLDSLKNLEDTQGLSKEQKKTYIEQKLIKEIHYAAENSHFYSKFYKDNLIDIDSIQKESDLEKLPFTTKEHLREQYPFGLLASSLEKVSHYAESTGTTGVPTSAYFSQKDWFQNNIYVAYRLMDLFSEDDIAIISAPYELSVPAQDLEKTFDLIGITQVACGVLNEFCSWEKTVDLIYKVQPTIMVASGTRVLLLSEVAQKMGYCAKKDFSVKKILNIGETANQSKAKKIKEIWGADVFNAYGMTETCSLAITCHHGNMHIMDDRYNYEVIDVQSGHNIKGEGKGELVITSLENEVMPLIRYKTNDQVSISTQPCECGNTADIMEHYGRIDDVIRIGEWQISYLKLEELIMSCESHNKFYRVEYDNKQMNITVDLKESYSVDFISEELQSNFPESVRDNIIINIFDKEEREEYIEYLKKSLKPFSKMFVKK
ncbi:AMP-binding protein [Paenibacillus sp. FSL L8-0436]|uniref:phenylacetate--CoA ligase family protein n=1 Tax=Paenibacillus sp. FSL L8-0436 TaxID=2954686 RepID=UPI003158806A